MLSDVLRYIAERGGAPVTEIQRVFDLPAEMAAELCIQLQDAGFLADQVLEPCHHLGGGPSCSGCSGGSCRAGASAGHAAGGSLAGAFERGCCGMNAPYVVTSSGLAYLGLG